MGMRDAIINSWPNSIQLETYRKDEVLALSVKELTEEELFYNASRTEDKIPQSGGLYDPCMGPMNRGEKCVTCGLSEMHCPGHCGHINLATPCINPILYRSLRNLLVSTCIDCNHFLCSEKSLRTVQAKMLCLNSGRLDLYNEIENETKENYGTEKDDTGEGDLLGIKGVATTGTKAKTLEALKDFLEHKTSQLDIENLTLRSYDRTIILLKRQTIDGFFDSYRSKKKKCPKCHKQQQEIKFGPGDETKVYLEVLTKQSINLDDNNTDDENEEKESQDEKVKEKEEMCLQRIPNKWLLRRIKKIFQVEKATTDLIFNGAGIELFFIETLLVPPNCFRRMNKAGRKVIAADRTAQLQAILTASQKLKWLLGYRAELVNSVHDEGYESQKDGLQAKSFLNFMPGKTLDEKQEHLEIKLQSDVNVLIDSNMEKASNPKLMGAKQRLEKKTGLFRQNIMGKRVNFCARTVITPDPCIGVHEFGVSDFVAKKLTYPERVTQYNYKDLQNAVINGPLEHPGAAAIIHPSGRREILSPTDINQRTACANQLLTIDNLDSQGLAKMKTVLRHLKTGDSIIANRQPTLHKGSIMSCQARVIPGEKVFRLHYSNCKHFNADFDGDEMNVHFPQTEEARAECEELMNTSHMFRSEKDGFPLAGLMQDHVIGGVMMTVRGAFFEKTDYHNLVINSIERFFGGKRIKFLPPAIFKPKQLWTGKQVLSTIILNMCGGTGPSYIGNCKMKDNVFVPFGKKERSLPNANHAIGCSMSETELIVRKGHMVSGYLDKNQIGASKYSILAAFEELFGGKMAANFITAITHLLHHYLKNYRGFTLSIKDVVTNPGVCEERSEIVKTADIAGLASLAIHFKLCDVFPYGNDEEIAKMDVVVREKLREAHLIGTDVKTIEIDSISKKAANIVTEKIHRLCEKNLESHFPDNNLEMLIHTGAKGSKANLLNMCSNLGQVEFDGQRPPLMVSGRTLPCFKPYEHNIRAGAFVGNRYCSGGLKPQEMFFHVMAGRDGLIDTACKTSSSGYLQRCLIKHLEGITMGYDRTVRDSDQSVIQFHFGEDGLDVAQTPYLNKTQFNFIKENSKIYQKQLWGNREIPSLSSEVAALQKHKESYIKRGNRDGWDMARNVGGIDRVLAFNDYINKHSKLTEFQEVALSRSEIKSKGRDLIDVFNDLSIKSWHQVSIKESKKSGKIRKNLDPPLEKLEKVFEDEFPLTEDIREKWIKKRYLPDPQISLLNPDVHLGSVSEEFRSTVHKYLYQNKSIQGIPMEELLFAKYQQSLLQPGDQIGLVIAQSIGEPSTQMTLNTFHLAGKADVNITLGIPRLRELLLTAPTAVKTPSMTIPFHKHIDEHQADSFCKTLKKVKLSDVITAIKGENKLLQQGSIFLLQSVVDIHIGNKLCKNFGLDAKHVLLNVIRKKLFEEIKKKHEKFAKDKKTGPAVVEKKNRNKKAPKECDIDINEVENEDKDIEGNDANEYEDADSEKENENDDEFLSDAEVKEDPDNEVIEEHTENAETTEIPVKITKALQIWEQVITNFKDIVSITHDTINHSWVHIVYNRRSDAEKVDIVQVIDAAVKSINIQGIDHLGKVTWKKNEASQEFTLLTEGINFQEFLKYPEILDLNKISTNDVNSFRERYGIEAAVMTIQREIDKVFKPYGIQIDKRHTSMLADYMTQEGKYRPFSRHGLKSCASPFQKMSYETTTQFLVDSIIYGENDDLSSPSARIATGQLFNGGTGYFDLQQQIIF